MWAGLSEGLEEAGELLGGGGAGAQRAAARESRVGGGSDGLVRCGRKEKEMGYSRARVAALVAVRSMVGGSSGLRWRIRMESLMVGPGVQPAARRAEAAAIKAVSSRWPRQRLMARRRGTASAARAAAKGRQQGWSRTDSRISNRSSSSCMRVG